MYLNKYLNKMLPNYTDHLCINYILIYVIDLTLKSH